MRATMYQCGVVKGIKIIILYVLLEKPRKPRGTRYLKGA